MASFVRFDAFVLELGLRGHNLDTDTLVIVLSNTEPDAANDADLGDITEISAGSGYSSGGETVANNAYALDGSVGELTGDDVVFTASGGPIGPLRYAVLANDTASGKLIGYWDHGSEITLADGDSLTIDFSAANGLLRIGA